MPIRSAFFESVAGDRRYTADRWAQIFAGIVTQGYVPGFANGLAVVESIPPAMSVLVSTGVGFIQGRFVEVYSTPVSLTVTAAHATQYRRDLVILRLDLSAGVRDIVATVKAGALAATAGAAVYPALQRDATIYEVALAGILVAPGDTAIQNADITDLREVGTNFGRSSFPDLTVHKAAAVLDHPDSSVTDAKIGNRTINPAMVPSNDGPAPLTSFLSFLANRIWNIVGGANWFTAPPSNMNALHSRTTTVETQLGGKYANDTAGQIPVYDGNRRVYDSLHVRGLYGSTNPNMLAVYDGNVRVWDSVRLMGQDQNFYATQSGLDNLTAVVNAINSVRPYTQVSFPSAAYIPAGYTRLSAADGRVLIGGGTTFGVAFGEGSQYGSSWSHNHAAAGLTGSVTTPTPSQADIFLAASANSNNNSGATNVSTGGHTHPGPVVSLGGATSQTQWIIPALCVAHAYKNP